MADRHADRVEEGLYIWGVFGRWGPVRFYRGVRGRRLAGSGARASVWAALTSVFVCGSGRRSAAVWRNTERRERALRALYAVASVCHFFR